MTRLIKITCIVLVILALSFNHVDAGLMKKFKKISAKLLCPVPGTKPCLLPNGWHSCCKDTISVVDLYCETETESYFFYTRDNYYCNNKFYKTTVGISFLGLILSVITFGFICVVLFYCCCRKKKGTHFDDGKCFTESNSNDCTINMDAPIGYESQPYSNCPPAPGYSANPTSPPAPGFNVNPAYPPAPAYGVNPYCN